MRFDKFIVHSVVSRIKIPVHNKTLKKWVANSVVYGIFFVAVSANAKNIFIAEIPC